MVGAGRYDGDSKTLRAGVDGVVLQARTPVGGASDGADGKESWFVGGGCAGCGPASDRSVLPVVSNSGFVSGIGHRALGGGAFFRGACNPGRDLPRGGPLVMAEEETRGAGNSALGGGLRNTRRRSLRKPLQQALNLQA